MIKKLKGWLSFLESGVCGLESRERCLCFVSSTVHYAVDCIHGYKRSILWIVVLLEIMLVLGACRRLHPRLQTVDPKDRGVVVVCGDVA